MSLDGVTQMAQEHMRQQGVDGWLLYDYRGLNPIFSETVGPVANVTRPCWLWIPSSGQPRLIVSYVDEGRFASLGIAKATFASRRETVDRLKETLPRAGGVAMEYSPGGALPRASRVDAGTIELVRGLDVEVVSSADLVQYATQRWSDEQLHSHVIAAEKLGSIVLDAFRHVGDSLDSGPTEHDVARFIRRRFDEEGLETTGGPVVAANEHSSDPHFEPPPGSSSVITRGDWLLVDLWGHLAGDGTMYADITWTAYVGGPVPAAHQSVFAAVVGARDAAVAELERAYADGRVLEGWQLDRVARDYISRAGYGDHFSHRLGHSLGGEVHGNAVNLDGWETHDTRKVVQGVAVTIEPGVYLPEFGVRSEIDVYMSDEGPRVTTSIQRSVVLIEV